MSFNVFQFGLRFGTGGVGHHGLMSASAAASGAAAAAVVGAASNAAAVAAAERASSSSSPYIGSLPGDTSIRVRKVSRMILFMSFIQAVKFDL